MQQFKWTCVQQEKKLLHLKEIFCSESKVFILEAFCLTLFKRIRRKQSEKDEVSQLYRDTIDEKEKKGKKLYRDW